MNEGLQGLSARPSRNSAGIWQGKLEPSVVASYTVYGVTADLRFAAKLCREYDQDAVMVFRHDDGPDTIHRLDPSRLMVDEAVASMVRHGIDGGTYDIHTEELRIAMQGQATLEALKFVAAEVGGRFKVEQRGTLLFVERDDSNSFTKSIGLRTKPYKVTIEAGASRAFKNMADSRRNS